MTFIKLTPHMDLKMSTEILGSNGDHIPINQLKDAKTGFSYTDSATVPCMVNIDQIARVYTGKVFTSLNQSMTSSMILNPDALFYDSIEYGRDELIHTVIEMTNGHYFSVIELPEYVTYLIAGRSPRNWPTNVARYHTLPTRVSRDDEETIPEMDELPVSQNYIG